MPEIGKINTLKVVKGVEFGIYLDGDELGEILLPSRYVPENLQPGEDINVFIYKDSEDRLIATTERPFAMVGDFSYLKVIDTNNSGAFLDWGLPKDLFVPIREQMVKMEVGKHYIVYVYLDEKSQRIAASTKFEKYIEEEPSGLFEDQQVELLICNKTDLGYKAIINNKNIGVLYENEVFKPLRIGEKTIGYIKKIRDDDKIDLALTKIGYDKTSNIAKKILNELEKNGGFLAMNDKTPSQEIYDTFGESKKSFKMALGALYKERRIKIEKEGIWLI